MSDKFSLQGSWTTTPQTGALLASGAPAFQATINENVTLSEKHYDELDLTSDGAQAVSFGGVTSANVVQIFCDRKVKARLTSADGAVQAVPIDGAAIIISKSVPFTALDLQRVAGQETRVKVFIGQKS